MNKLLRRSLVTYLLVGFSLDGVAQNLVPNPSFEEHLDCLFLDDDCNDWFTFKGSPDYIHYCYYSNYDNGAGYQQPRTGEAYAGFINYGVNTPPNGKEILGVELIAPLTIGEKYFVSFYVSAGYTSAVFNVATNNIGALFSTYSFYDPFMDIPNPNFSHINSNNIIADTVNWVKISGSFIADSAYTFIAIGTFYDDINTDTLQLPFTIGSHLSYYFLDDVCVSTDSLHCELWTGLNITEKNINTIIYPNPTRDYIIVQSNYGLQNIEIFNSQGQSVFNLESTSHYQEKINLASFGKGMYYVRVSYKSAVILPQLIKIVIN